MNSPRDTLQELWRRCRYLASRFVQDKCPENAAALTYMSLFALVPLLTVLFTIASAVPAFQGMEEQVQDFLFENLMPEKNDEIQQYLSDFSRQAKNLTGAGVVFLVVTAVLMLRNIENAFNHIWRATTNRSPVASFLLYWAVLTLAPITIGVALALSTWLSSFTHVLEEYDIIGLRAFILQSTPLLLSAAGFTLIYAAVPNCRVPFKHTVIGGLATALAFNVARSLFTDLMVGSSYTLIYGAFAAVPLFLLWIYLSWNLVLAGGILVHSMSAYQSEEVASYPTVLKALHVLYLFWERQQVGKSVREIELLNGKHKVVQGLDSETWGTLRDTFIDKELITMDERGNYLLARDLHTVSFWQIKEWVNAEQPLDDEDNPGLLSWQDEAYRLLCAQRSQQRELLAVNLVELFQK